MRKTHIVQTLSAVLACLMLVSCMVQTADPPLPTVELSSTAPIRTSTVPVTSTKISENPQTSITTSTEVTTPAITTTGQPEPVITPEVTVSTDSPITEHPGTSSVSTPGTTKQDPVTDPTTSSQTPTQLPKPETSITPGTSKTEETPIPTPHTHSYGAWTTVKAATCTATGTQQRTCSCGDKQTQTIAATGHKWSGWTVTKAATEQAEGEESRSCSSCKQTETRAIPKLPHTHSYGAWTTVKAATCTATGTQQRSCSCGDKQTQSIPATGHNWSKTKTVAATCTEQGYTVYTCKNCKQTRNDDYTAATGHSWGAWVVTKAATTEAEGVETRTCSKCGNKETRSIAKLPQEYTEPDTEWMAEYFLQLLNEERAKAGVQQLVTGSILHQMAQVRADELIILFDHSRPNKDENGNIYRSSQVGTIFDDFEYGNYYPEGHGRRGWIDSNGEYHWDTIYYSPTKSGEDIGAGIYDYNQTMQECVERNLAGFKASPGHWNDMMNNAYGAVGVAISAKEFAPGCYEIYFEVLLVDRLYE